MDAASPDDGQARREAVTAELRDAYRDALLLGLPAAADRTIREAIELGLSELAIDDLIIAPTMRFVGDLWAIGDISVAQEHLATAISKRVIALQHERFRVAHRRVGRRILLAAVEGEHHTLGLEMAASALLHAGYDVRMLGADVPTADLSAAVAQHAPAVIGLTTTTMESASAVRDAIAAARSVRPSTGILVGGAAAADAAAPDPALSICTHVGDVLDLTNELVQRARLN